MADGRERLVVLGGGIAGLASAWFAASLSDLEVVVVEREPRHDAHSSGRSAEIQRIAIPDPVARELAMATDAVYANPEGSGLPRTWPSSTAWASSLRTRPRSPNGAETSRAASRCNGSARTRPGAARRTRTSKPRTPPGSPQRDR